MMHGIERFLIVTAFLMTGTLIFVSVNRSWQKTQTTVRDGNDCSGTPVVKAVSAADRKAAASFVANPFCKACHLDFDEEELALNHEVFGIGCERCHGESLRHRSDEANITPPEIMYPKERINPSCMSCHPRQDIQDTKDHQPILEAGLSTFEEATPVGKDAKKYCTDCHGSKHRVMRVRATHWDKATGALLKKGN
jgi:hypothetical protein